MNIFKKIIGYGGGVIFLSWLAYQFYKSIEEMESAGFIIWIACIILLIIIWAVRRILLD